MLQKIFINNAVKMSNHARCMLLQLVNSLNNTIIKNCLFLDKNGG